ncbi:hypothetical protein LEM8419_02749 [Neolewinella maritima]|uniref:SnoaL-like domain-containing protein n=1 Tax=Neolewinella maritima TaxID=1383882 RepID=A0ABM9B3D2_9BACT|nr:nuclear transport factor 2 family protein [Neolewinella maritima]CAH1001841.1 hypothetical protein LEM8419_02749 [Neolewinella maritima]
MLRNLLLLPLLLVLACGSPPPPDDEAAPFNVASEKAAILQTLNEETIAAFSRDYRGWQDKWVQKDYVSKIYMNFVDSSMTETRGWDDVKQFVVDYFAEHPAPDPLPEPLTDIEVRLYGDGAWVSYEQDDPARGRKLEERLLERIDGQWKIAGMRTVIYGE